MYRSQPIHAARAALSALACAVCVAFTAGAQAQQTITFAVNEGVTYRTGAEGTKQNYKAIADDLSKIMKAKVQIEVVPEYATLEKELAARAYGIAFIHPTHVALAAVKRGHYSLAAVSKAHTNYRASFLSKASLAAASPEDLVKMLASANKPVGAPDPNSITTLLIRATLRDAALATKSNAPQLKFTRYQESIPYMVDNGFVDVAATASESIVKQWTASGGKIVAASKPVPIKNLIISEALPKDVQEAVRAYFMELSGTAEGQAKLEKIGLKQGFVGFDQGNYVALAGWLGL